VSQVQVTKHAVFGLFTVFGVNYAEKIKAIQESGCRTAEEFERKVESLQASRPEILGWIDKNSVSELPMEPTKYLKKKYPYTKDALAMGSIAFPEHDMKRVAEDPFFRLKKLTSAKDARQHKKFYTYIATDAQGSRTFIQSLQYTKVFEVTNEDLGYSSLFQVVESMQISSLHSAPIIEVMTNFLEFIYDTAILPTNNKLLADSFNLNRTNSLEPEDLETLILQRGPEFISTVAFQHLHFQEKILHNISLQFPK
jgi:uncharacterized protein YqiB (DUF1249 family)